jgi:hypothetical protein
LDVVQAGDGKRVRSLEDICPLKRGRLNGKHNAPFSASLAGLACVFDLAHDRLR